MMQQHDLLVGTFGSGIQTQYSFGILETLVELSLGNTPFNQLVHHGQVHVLEALSFKETPIVPVSFQETATIEFQRLAHQTSSYLVEVRPALDLVVRIF